MVYISARTHAVIAVGGCVAWCYVLHACVAIPGTPFLGGRAPLGPLLRGHRMSAFTGGLWPAIGFSLRRDYAFPIARWPKELLGRPGCTVGFFVLQPRHSDCELSSWAEAPLSCVSMQSRLVAGRSLAHRHGLHSIHPSVVPVRGCVCSRLCAKQSELSVPAGHPRGEAGRPSNSTRLGCNVQEVTAVPAGHSIRTVR